MPRLAAKRVVRRARRRAEGVPLLSAGAAGGLRGVCRAAGIAMYLKTEKSVFISSRADRQVAGPGLRTRTPSRFLANRVWPGNSTRYSLSASHAITCRALTPSWSLNIDVGYWVSIIISLACINRIHFPADKAATKLLCLPLRNIAKDWETP